MLVACCDQNLRDLDVALLEDDLALLAADDGGPQVPLDLVERVDTFLGEEAFVFQAGDAGATPVSRTVLLPTRPT